MIDTIALWVGYIIIDTTLLLLLSIAWYYIWSNFTKCNLEIKAFAYMIASKSKSYMRNNKTLSEKIDLRQGREWWSYYKGKWYLWKCIKEELRESVSKRKEN